MTHLNRRTALQCSLALAGAIAAAGATPTLGADPATVTPPPGVKVFSRMPKTANDVASAHLSARNEGIEFLPKGEPLELSSFKPSLNNREAKERERDRNKSPLTIVTTRKFVLSVGIEVDAADQVNLPALSKATILDYLGNHYVSLQARIQKDSKGNMYLHHRPVVATAKFGKVKITEDFVEGVVTSIRDMHSLGIYVPAKTPPSPENLRTVVMIHKHAALDMGRKEARYEFVIIRARLNSLAGKLEPYCFATSDERTKLHYLKPAKSPLRYSECSIRAQVQFTRFTGGDLIPAESVVRSQSLISQSTFNMTDLDSFVKTDLKLSGDALTNINEVLDSIIDGRIKPAKPAAVTPVRPTTPMPATGTVNKPAGAR